MRSRMTRTVRICILASLIFSLIGLSGCGDSEAPAVAAMATEAATPAARADAYAPKLVVPKNLPDDPGAGMIVMFSENSVVPSAAEVNVPLYPGAKVMSAMGAMEMTSNDVKMTSFPSVTLLTADETAETVAFYQEQLAGWRYKEFFGTHSFWNGDEDSNPLDITGQFSLVVVVPVEETDTVRAMWPEMRTRIDLRYEPSVP